MRYEDALKKLDGAQSVGGQLIVYRDGKHVVVGKHHDGELIDVTEEGKALLGPAKPPPSAEKTGRRARGAISEPEPETVEEPAHHDVAISDEVITQENLGS